MTTDREQANIQLLRDAMGAMNARDVDRCVSMMAEDFLINLSGVPQMRGTDIWRAGTQVLFTAFPDIRIEVEDIFAMDDRVAMRVRFRGTHTGPFQQIPPSGRPIDYVSNEIYRVADGRIAEEWIVSDMLTLLTQIGALPADAL